MHESTRLDKLSSIILVIAAVAPLLGLLGTVTGMIATFDVITEFGTGDPKLLSGGISIALVTTELGLIVAIPLLLGGNLLNSWAESIKDNMEHSALHIVNEYNKQK
jgi:biopolymer transport protein ExbB